jgi:hypothetical protein
MATAFSLISSNTVGAGGTGSITFSSIPATYTDLMLLMSLRQDGAGNNVRVAINGITTGYTEMLLYGSGSVAGSTTASTSYFNLIYTNGSAETANNFGNLQIYIPNYRISAQKNLSMDSVYENNSTGATVAQTGALWNNTAAITSLVITPATTNWIQHSTAYLYGIKNS